MADVIKQDSGSINKIGDDLDANGNEFARISKEMFDDINREIGEDMSHATWYGPNARAFANNVNTKRAEFEKAANNMKEHGNNLMEQAKSWENFEKA